MAAVLGKSNATLISGTLRDSHAAALSVCSLPTPTYLTTFQVEVLEDLGIE